MLSTSTEVDPKTLVVDMPVDPANVKEIERQIKAWGGIHTEVEVWIKDNRIIDGMHRVQAAVNLGIPQIDIKLFDCTEEDFWDKRISQARKHFTVEPDRLAAWMAESWRSYQAEAKLPDNLDEILYAIYHHMVGSKNIHLKPAHYPILAWFLKKSGMWGRKPDEIARILLEKYKVFSPANPELTQIGGSVGLDLDTQKKLIKELPSGVRKKFGRGANSVEANAYAKELLDNPDLRFEEWQNKQKERAATEKLRQAQYLATPAGVEEKRKRSIENGIEAINGLRVVEHRISDLMAIDISEVLLAYPGVAERLNAFLIKASELALMIGGDPLYHASAMEISMLRLQNSKQAEIIELQDKRIAELQARSPAEIRSSALALSSTEIERMR